MDYYGFSYFSQAHREACNEQDRRTVKDLPDDYLATFIAHFASGKKWTDLPNSLLSPHPMALAEEAKARGWNCKRVGDDDRTLLIELPDHAKVLSPPPTVMPKKVKTPKKVKHRAGD